MIDSLGFPSPGYDMVATAPSTMLFVPRGNKSISDSLSVKGKSFTIGPVTHTGSHVHPQSNHCPRKTELP